jgi:uncharacterized protein YlxP (DUF503 family)
MVLGAARVELLVHGSRSLKEKRGVVRSITQRVRNRFNVSVAEVGGQGTWQRVELGLTSAGADASVVRARLEKAVDFIADLGLAEVIDQEVEVVATPLAGYASWAGDEDEDEEES